MSDDTNPDPDTGPDLSFVPETFKGEDGTLDTAGFRAQFDELATFKAQADEAKATLPETPEGYQWGVGEDFAWPEGFDPQQFRQPVLNADGTPKKGLDGQPEMRDLTPDDILDPKDPDIPALQETLHKHGARPEMMNDIAKLMMAREVRQWKAAGEAAAAEKAALGPNAASRISTLTASLEKAVPAAQAKAILDSVTSADALRGLEELVKKSNTPPSDAPGTKIDNATASIRDRISAGLQRRA